MDPYGLYEVMQMRRRFFCVLLLLVIGDVVWIHWYCKQAIDLISVPVAACDIYARTQIDASMLEYVELPSAYVQDHAYRKEEDIIGKYTELGYKIEKGSLFYTGSLFREKDLPDAPSLKLKKGQTAFTLPVDLVKLSGNTITEDQKVDIYVSIDQSKGAPLVDKLIQAVRVVGIKDRNGYDISDAASSHIPYVAILAVDDDQIMYLKKAERIGEIDILAPSMQYPYEEESILNEESSILSHLE